MRFYVITSTKLEGVDHDILNMIITIINVTVIRRFMQWLILTLISLIIRRLDRVLLNPILLFNAV